MAWIEKRGNQKPFCPRLLSVVKFFGVLKEWKVSMYPYVQYDGTQFAPFPSFLDDPEKTLEGISNLESRANDVIICSPMKTGTHWVHEIMAMLLSLGTDYNSQATVGQRNLECKYKPEVWEAMSDPRLFQTHLPLRYLPENHVKHGYKIVYVNRNPKDRWVSLYEFLKGKYGVPRWTWNEFFEQIVMQDELYDGWFKYTKTFEKAARNYSNILKVLYEDLVIDPVGTVKKMADFLEIQCTEKYIKEIVTKCTLENLRKNKTDLSFMIDKKSRSTLFRKGVIGDWKNWFTVSQNERFDKLYDTEMTGSDVNFIFDNDVEANGKETLLTKL